MYIFNFNKILVFHLIAIDLHQAKEKMYLYHTRWRKNLVQNTNEVNKCLGLTKLRPNVLIKPQTAFNWFLILCESYVLCFQVHRKNMNDWWTPLKTKPFQSFESVAHGRLARADRQVLHSLWLAKFVSWWCTYCCIIAFSQYTHMRTLMVHIVLVCIEFVYVCLLMFEALYGQMPCRCPLLYIVRPVN